MTTTNDTPDIQNFDEFKAEFAKAWAKIAEENGRTTQELLTDTITGLLTAYLFGRAARQGNVAKTIFWGVRSLQLTSRVQADRAAARRKRERATRLASVDSIIRH